jgi:CAAX protease family protein
MSATAIDLRRTALPIALVLCALALRPPTWTAFGVTIAAGVAGLIVPLVRHERTRPAVWAGVVALGCAAFALVRLRTMLPPPPVAQTAVVTTIAAAIAEEAFFRRLVYSWLERWGAATAITGAAIAFAAIHVPAYGLRTLPINLAVGVLFGWQRWATGGWTAPAATHVFANLVQSW